MIKFYEAGIKKTNKHTSVIDFSEAGTKKTNKHTSHSTKLSILVVTSCPAPAPAVASLVVSVDWVDNKTVTDECQASVRCVPFVIHFVMIVHGRHPRPKERVTHCVTKAASDTPHVT